MISHCLPLFLKASSATQSQSVRVGPRVVMARLVLWAPPEAENVSTHGATGLKKGQGSCVVAICMWHVLLHCDLNIPK